MRMTKKMSMIIAVAAGIMIVTVVVAAPVAVVLGGGGVLLLSFNSSSSYYQPAMAQQQEITDTGAGTTTTGLNTSITTTTANTTTTQSQTSESEDVNTLYSRGYVAYEQGMYQQAIEYFDRVLAIDPNFLEALNYKGNSLLGLGRYEEAIEYYDRALAIDANYVKALINKGNALSNLDRHQEAIEYYDRALAIDANQVIALINKADLLLDLGGYEEAIEYYDRVLALDPNFLDALTSKGLALSNLGRYQEAIEYYDRALAIDPNYIFALNNKGVALHYLGRYQEAIEYYDRALAIDPNFLDALNSKGVAVSNLGRYQEAIEYYDRALAIDPNFLEALNSKGVALHYLGRYQEAIEYYDKVLAIDPNHVDALRNRALALDNLGGGGGNVTTTTTTTASTNATTSGGGGGNSTDFLTYDNATYGVTIQYPSNWLVQTTDFPGDPLTQIVTFFSPPDSRIDTFQENLWIAQEQQSFSEDFDLEQYAEQIVSNYNSTLTDFNLEEIDTETARLGNNDSPAYRIVYTYAMEFVDSPGVTVDLKSMEIGTVIGDKLYIVEYDADIARYDQYLPIIEEMINSVQLSDSREVVSDASAETDLEGGDTDGDIATQEFWTSDNTSVNLSNETGPLSTGAQIAASGDNVYVVWQDNSNYTENYYKTDIFYAKSSDDGNTFGKPVNISNNKSNISWDAQIAASGDNVYVVWERYNSTGDGKDDIFFTKSSDGGTTFSKPINLSTDNSNDTSSGMADIAASRNDVHVVWFDETAPGVGKIMYTKSSDNGTTFDEPISISNDLTRGLAIEVSQYNINNVYVVWSTVFGSEAGLFPDKIMFSHSGDGGNSFGEPRNINDNRTAGFIPSIDSSNNSSTIYVVWNEQNATGTDPTGITLVRSLDGGNEFGPPTHSGNITGLFGMAKVVTSDDNDVYIVWNAGQDIFMTSSAADGGGNIFLDNPMNLSNNRAGFRSFEPDIAAASDDALFIVWSSAAEAFVDAEEIIFKKIEN